MEHGISRRELFQRSIVGVLALVSAPSWSQDLQAFILRNAAADPGNFHLIYSNPKLKSEFLLFLKHVYNIYPEDKLHALIAEAVQRTKTDQEVYAYVLGHLADVKPFLSELTYALPALAHQKIEIAAETLRFVKRRGKLNGYLEVGTPGRYIGRLQDEIPVEGPVFLVNVTKPGYSPVDIAERGQLTPIGEYIGLNDYAPITHPDLKENSLDVVTNYIGFHHCPLPKLEAFVRSTHRCLRPGGSLILRDHDVTSPEMNAMVALAHDVFNCGLREPWENNHKELRHFRSLDEWTELIQKMGFRPTGQRIYQPGDPTKNALMEFVKV